MKYNPSHAKRHKFRITQFQLESGVTISDLTLTYVIHGALPKKEASNVILVTSSLGGDAHRLDFLIGEALALSPQDYCIICVDAIGNGHSSSPSNNLEFPRQTFPKFSILDMVNSQKRLLNEIFGLHKILAVAGASMGGMQALQWAVSYPDFMKAIIALVPIAKTPPWTRLVHETARRVIMADLAWNHGEYTDRNFKGWQAAIALTQGLVARSPQYTQVDIQNSNPLSWLDNLITQTLLKGMDPNDWMKQSEAYDRFNIGKSEGFSGDVKAALASIKAQALILGSETDLLNPIADQRAAAAAIPDAQFKLIPSERGHMAANLGDPKDISFMNTEIGAFLNRISTKQP